MKKILILLLMILPLLACELSEEPPLPTLAPTLTPRPSTTPAPSPTVAPTVAASPTIPAPTATSVPTSTLVPVAREVGQIRLNDPQRLLWASDGKTLAVINPTSVQVYEAASLSGLVTYNAPNAHSVLDLSLETESVLTSLDRKNLDVRKYGTGQVTRTIRLTTAAQSASFAPEGNSVAVASGEQIAVQLWEVGTGKQTLTLKGFQTAAPVYSFYFSPDGKTLIWVSRATVQLMDIETSKLGTSVRHEDFVSAVTMSKDGKLLATLSATTANKQLVGLVKVVDMASGSEKASLTQKGLATAIAFSPEGKFLAVGLEKTIAVWEVATQKEVLTIAGHTDKINSLAFSPDGRGLVSSSKDGTVRFWRLP